MRKEVGWQFEKLADRDGFVIAYPDGTSYEDYGKKSKNDGKGHWNDGRNVKGYYSTDKNVDDVGFVSFLISHVSGKVKVDAKRVYVTGFSNGGIMANRIACQLSDKIAAVAPVGATFGTSVAASCNPSRYVPVLMVNGDADPLITWNGQAPTFPGETLESLGEKIAVTDAIAKWKKVNECSETAVSKATMNADRKDGTTVDVSKYASCGGFKDIVQTYVVKGGGHTWPNGNGVLPASLIGKTTKEFDGGEVVWNFFKDKTLQPANRSSYPGCSSADITVGVRKWAACNVGSSSSSSPGTYFQWGKNDATFDFYNWKPNSGLWGGGKGGQYAQGPCATGYHVPTDKEWKSALAEYANNYSSLGSVLKLGAFGYKYGAGGISDNGKYASYWTSDSQSMGRANVVGKEFMYQAGKSSAQKYNGSSYGFQVRCIKN